jgi:anhydro-N-acetylmuramic acid kinase
MTTRYVGLMSGSSLDAIDAVLVEFEHDTPRLLGQLAYPLNPELKQILDDLTRTGPDELAQACHADVLLGHQLAAAVLTLLDQTGIPPESVRAIGSHGQTVRHYPDTETPTTLQIGDPNIIVEQTGITTVADFRRRDMAAGGQGAPLVSAFHQAMFQLPDKDRVILNIGGIANLTLLPNIANAPVSGFDTGPGNALLDAWITRHRDEPYDNGGNWAVRGQLQKELLTALLGEPYFYLAAPKSTGRDRFNLEWVESCWPSLASLPPADVQATLLELTAITIVDALREARLTDWELLVCGGGVHNTALMQRLATLLPGTRIETTANSGVDPDWVEAMAFAWLAHQTLENRPGNLPAVTGAGHPVVLGGIYPGRAGI